jgi:hypothetical protein
MRSDCEQQPTTLDPSPLHGSYGSTRIVSVVVSCVDAPAEEWDHLDLDVLRPSRSGAVCVTCQHFRYEVGKHCVTVLTCPNQQCLIPQGEHLTKRCARWVARREGQGRLKVRHKAAGAGMLVPFSSGLLASLGPAFCQY